MINITEDNFVSAVRKAYFALYELKDVPDDLELLKESSAVVLINKFSKKDLSISLINGKFFSDFDYFKYFPWVKPDLIDLELKHWRTELVSPPRLDKIIYYLKENPLSKRAIVNLWQDKHRDLSVSCPCTPYIFFRRKGKVLEMHSHMRANNAYFLLFMDIHFLSGIQKIVADKLGLKVGDYIHFVDSLIFFKKDKENIDKQYKFMKETPIW